jgi:hypothetical protein
MSAGRWIAVVAFAGMLLADATSTRAQQGIAVQLPTFSYFAVATTVVVPDSGGAYSAAAWRARSGRNRVGPPFGRGQGGMGQQALASGVHARAQIHDLSESDQSLRGPAANGSPLGRLSRQMAAAQAEAASSPLTSLKDIERQRNVASDAQQAAAADFLRRGLEAEAAGKTALAKTYYNIALRRATGELRHTIAAQLKQLDSPPAPQVAAQP